MFSAVFIFSRDGGSCPKMEPLGTNFIMQWERVAEASQERSARKKIPNPVPDSHPLLELWPFSQPKFNYGIGSGV